MRALVVLYCYPPLLVPAAICYAKLMAGLAKSGVEVEILTLTPESFESPDRIEASDRIQRLLPPEIVQHAVPSPETSLWVRALKKADPERRFTRRWLEPWKREWTAAALRYLRRLDLSRYDVLLTCSQPHANHLVGLELQREAGLPWIAYFSDPWTDNPYAHFRSEGVRAYHRALEDRVLGAADLVLFTCEEMLRLVRRNHPVLAADRAGVLPHAFVTDWYARPGLGEAPAASPRVRILQTGSFYGPRTPLPLVEALVRILQDVDLKEVLQVDSYGGMAPEHRQAIVDRGLEGIISVRGFIPYLDTLALMGQYDALLLVDAPLTTTTESVFLPSKLIDYLGSRKPVLAVTPEQGATARVVKEVGGVVCPLEAPERLETFLRELMDHGSDFPRPRESEIVRYEHLAVGHSLAKMMQKLGARS